MDSVIYYGYTFNAADFEEIPYCGACSGTVRDKVVTLHQSMGIDSLKCRRCGLISASHHLKPEALNRYYSNYSEHNMKQAKWQDGVTFDGPNRLAMVIAQSIDINSEQAKILDYGGANGSITYFTAPVHFNTRLAAILFKH